MDKALKIKYHNDFAKIRLLVNKFDPCGFIEGGAPDDEYDSLTNKILSSLYNKLSQDDLRRWIIHEIENNFGTPILSELDEHERAKFYNDLETILNTAKK